MTHRPIGVTLLAAGAAIAGLYQIWRIIVFLGIADFTFVGRPVSFQEPQWGQALWALILAAIWFWVAAGFWNVRAWAWQFGIFISLFTLIWGFFAVLFGSSMEAETIPWLLAGIIYFYLSYPGVRDAFVQHEMSLLTPEQRAAVEQLNAANEAAARKTTPPGMAMPAAAVATPAAAAATPPPAPTPPSAPAPPPSDTGTTAS
jgi:hypothetical protein